MKKELLLIAAAIGAIAGLYIIPIASVAYAIAAVSFIPIGLTAALVKPRVNWQDLLLSWVIFWAFYALLSTLSEASSMWGEVLSITAHCYSALATAIIIRFAMRGRVFLTNYVSSMRRLVLTQCMLSAVAINVIASVKPRFDHPCLMAIIIAIAAATVCVNLLIHLRINANDLGVNQRISASVVTFTLIAVFVWTINWSGIVLHLVAYFALAAQTVVLLIRFTEPSPTRYWLTVATLVLWIVAPFAWAYFTE